MIRDKCDIHFGAFLKIAACLDRIPFESIKGTFLIDFLPNPMDHRPPSFFDVETQLDKIYQINAFLPRLNTLNPWKMFRDDLLKLQCFRASQHISRTR